MEKTLALRFLRKTFPKSWNQQGAERRFTSQRGREIISSCKFSKLHALRRGRGGVCSQEAAHLNCSRAGENEKAVFLSTSNPLDSRGAEFSVIHKRGKLKHHEITLRGRTRRVIVANYLSHRLYPNGLIFLIFLMLKVRSWSYCPRLTALGVEEFSRPQRVKQGIFLWTEWPPAVAKF